MGYAVELFLKEEQSKDIRRLFSSTHSVLLDIGTKPHISLAVFDDVDVHGLTAIVRDFARLAPPFKIRFSSIGVFPGVRNVVFLAPVVNNALQKAHIMLHEFLQAEAFPCQPYYLPDNWVPHCAISVEEPIEQSLDTIRRIHEAAVFGEYMIDNVNVVRFRPAVTLSSFQLGKDDAEAYDPGGAIGPFQRV